MSSLQSYLSLCLAMRDQYHFIYAEFYRGYRRQGDQKTKTKSELTLIVKQLLPNFILSTTEAESELLGRLTF